MILGQANICLIQKELAAIFRLDIEETELKLSEDLSHEKHLALLQGSQCCDR